MNTLRSLLFLLLSSVALGQYHWPTFVYDNGMEQGDIWAFTSTDRLGANSVVYATNDVVHGGAYSLYWRFDGEAVSRQARAFYTLTNSPNHATGMTNYCRLYFRIGSNTAIPTSSSINLMTWYNTGGEERLSVYNSAGSWVLRSSTLAANGGSVTTNTWYCVEAKFKPGAGDAQIQYWQDGVSIINSSTATLNLEPQSIRFGQHGYVGTSSAIYAECWMDDMRVAYEPIGTLDQNITLHVPDLRGRIGVPALAELTDFTAGDRVVWKLGNATATNAIITNTVVASGAIRGRIPLLSLTSGHQVLIAEYQTSTGTPKDSDQHAWTNDYSGNPPVSIDEFNRFCISNAPIWILGNFVDRYDNSEQLYSSNIINVMSGGDWNDRTVVGMSNVMNKLWAVGARTEAGIPPITDYKWTTNDIAAYVTNLRNHPGLFSWFWEDEPTVGNGTAYHTPRDLYDYWRTAKAIDGRWASGNNYLGAQGAQFYDANGGTFALVTGTNSVPLSEASRENSMEDKAREMHTFAWPWLTSDYYGVDTYPYFYTNQASMATFVLSSERMTSWNLGLTPGLTFVQPYKLRDVPSKTYESAQPPTTNQVQLMFWASVASGASGMRWFEYHEARETWTNNAWANMQYIGKTLTNWQHAILADTTDTVTSAQEYREPPQAQLYTGPGIVLKSTKRNGTNWVFAVNLSKTYTNVSFHVSGLLAGTPVTKGLAGGTITSDAGSFDDVIPYDGFEVYQFSDAAPTNYHYVRAGASGTGGGTNWTDALTDLPTTFIRGHRYYIADGSYGPHTFSNLAGTNCVEIVKATEADHGTGTGWDSSYGDGVAVFTNAASVFTVAMQYLTIDGVTGSGNSGHGIKLASASTTDGVGALVVAYGTSATGLRVRNTEMHTAPWGNANAARVVYLSSATTSDVQFGNCYLHGGRVWISTASINDILIENCWMENCGSNDSLWHSAGLVHSDFTNATIRFNTFKNMLGIANTTYIEPQSIDRPATGMWIYGNVFVADDPDEDTSQGIFAITSNDDVRNVHIYNNTIYRVGSYEEAGQHGGIHDGSPGGYNVVATNNLWFGTGAKPVLTAVYHDYNASEYDLIEDHNQILTGNPFVSSATGDFRLAAATDDGVTLAAPFNMDIVGNTRGVDGVWDIGAYEYTGEITDPDPDPDPTPSGGAPRLRGGTLRGGTMR